MNRSFIVLLGLALVTSCGQPAANVTKPATTAANSANTATREKTSLSYMSEGIKFYELYEFEKSIPPLSKAYDMEKVEKKLEKKLWFALLDNLAMAYGLTDDIEHSREVVDYGISQEPTYPMFYYIKACGDAVQNDEGNAIKNLRMAYHYKANAMPGETLPDPATDNSFKELAKRESFRKAVDQMKAGK